MWERLRQPNDSAYWLPISVAGDRRRGDNWPVFRTEQELARLRQHSRVLCTSNAYAKGLLKNLTNYIVGPGFSYKAVSKELTDAKPDQPGTQDDDATKAVVAAVQDVVDQFTRANRWGQREREVFRRTKRDGEAFLRLFHQDDGSTLVRFIEPEAVVNPPGGLAEEGWTYGIQHQTTPFEDVETAIALWVVDPANPSQGEVIDAADVIHVLPPDYDTNVKRGIPEFAFDAGEALERAAKLQRHLSIGAAVRAGTAEIWQHANATQAQIQDLRSALEEYTSTNPVTGQDTHVERSSPGTIRRIPQGQELVPQPQDWTGSYIQGVQGDLRQASTAFSAPEYMTGDASNGNYASAREAGTPFVLAAESEQAHYGDVFREVVTRAVRWRIERGQLPANALRLVEVQVEGPSVKQRDELQKAQVDQILVTMGSKSPQTVAMEWGLDPEVEAFNSQQHAEQFGPPGGPMDTPPDEPPAPPGGGGKPPFDPAGGGGADVQESSDLVECDDATPAPPITLPDIRQQTDWSCGAAALRAVALHCGVGPESEADFRALLGTDPHAGTRPAEMLSACASLGLPAFAASGMDVADLTHHAGMGRVTLCPIQADDPAGQAGGHWVDVTGCDGYTVTLHDPARGPLAMPADEFVRRWHDVDGDGKPYVRYGIVVSGPDAATMEADEGNADPGNATVEDDPDAFAQMMAEILYGLYGDDALATFSASNEKDVTESRELVEAWNHLDHPRGKGGKFIPKGSGEAGAAAKEAVGKVLAGDKSAASAEKLAEHLSILSVKQLRELHQQHGQKVPGKLRAQLVESVKARLPAGTAKKPTAKSSEPPAPKPTSELRTASPAQVDQEIRNGATEVFRGIPDAKAVKETTAGKHYTGQGDYGSGAYYTTDRFAAEGYAAGPTGESDGGVVRAALLPSAKVVSIEDLDRQHQAAIKAGTATATEDYGTFARRMGYDAIQVKHKGYMNVVNPDALVVQNKPAAMNK